MEECCSQKEEEYTQLWVEAEGGIPVESKVEEDSTEKDYKKEHKWEDEVGEDQE